MNTALRAKNWQGFQHYKDRAPPWIKLHRGLLDDMEFALLSPEAGKWLPLLWLIASDTDGFLPEAGKIAFRLRLTVDCVEQILEELVSVGFFSSAPAEQAAPQPKSNPSRHIPEELRIKVRARDQNKCVWCGSIANLEYDHITPISKGGVSILSNLQLLCRACNRKKRVGATPPLRRRSLEEEREVETEGEGDLDSLRSSYESPDGDPKPERQSPIVTKVLAAYHAKLPKCLAVAVVGPKRKKRILAADKLARSVCKNQGWEYDPEVFWGEYFGDCSRDAWMRGEVPNPKNANWKQNIDVLLAEDRFAGIMDRALESMRDGA